MTQSVDNEKIPRPISGIRLNAVQAGVRYADRLDLALIEIAEGARSAAVFTQNAFSAAPVVLARKHLASCAPKYLLINSGNANAGTGALGLSSAEKTCQVVSFVTHCASEAVLPFSTGVIGEHLPVEKFEAAMPMLVNGLSENNWSLAARAIMTTDLVPKTVTRQVMVDDNIVSITGIAKGSGMIHPNMATMLAFIATDAKVDRDLLQNCLNNAVSKSFNCITVDGDTSTNDACVLIATGKREGVSIENTESPYYLAFSQLVEEVCIDLAIQLVRDAEGATKFVTINVEQAIHYQEAKHVAYTVALSPLVKTALFASDPNWGRILAAVGRAGISELNVDLVEIYLGDVCIVENGGRAASYTEDAGQAIMEKADIDIRIVLKRGNTSARVWTCDFSQDYVRINAEYRT